jgi:hypothetical protein
MRTPRRSLRSRSLRHTRRAQRDQPHQSRHRPIWRSRTRRSGPREPLSVRPSLCLLPANKKSAAHCPPHALASGITRTKGRGLARRSGRLIPAVDLSFIDACDRVKPGAVVVGLPPARGAADHRRRYEQAEHDSRRRTEGEQADQILFPVNFGHSPANASTSRQTSSDKRRAGHHDRPIRTAKQFE